MGLSTKHQGSQGQVKAPREGLGWFGVFRLGLVQTALGAIVILTTSTLNRVMVVELALPATLPGLLVGWHYGIQMSRPRWGYGSDVGGSRVRWIIGGMALLAVGAVAAAMSTAFLATSVVGGVAAAFASFSVIGIGVGASGTNLLALLATHAEPERKAAAAAIVWIMMITGFVMTAATVGQLLDPFSLSRLVVVTASVSCLALLVTTAAVWGIEKQVVPPGHYQAELAAQLRGTQGAEGAEGSHTTEAEPEKPSFKESLNEVWAEPQARKFTIFVFVSMLAYSTQDLILEPFAGLVYGYTPGESTSMAGVQNGGVLLGMILTAVVGTTIGKSRAGFMRKWTVAGCVASSLALAVLAYGSLRAPDWPLSASVFGLGLANGAFAVAAIGSMMTLASAGREGREGMRMGLWGAAQALAFGLGGLLGAVAIDLTRMVVSEPAFAFTIVFAGESMVFLLAAYLALGVGETAADSRTLPAMPAGDDFPFEAMSEKEARERVAWDGPSAQ